MLRSETIFSCTSCSLWFYYLKKKKISLYIFFGLSVAVSKALLLSVVQVNFINFLYKVLLPLISPLLFLCLLEVGGKFGKLHEKIHKMARI